jgi:hypothetical protein
METNDGERGEMWVAGSSRRQSNAHMLPFYAGTGTGHDALFHVPAITSKHALQQNQGVQLFKDHQLPNLARCV